MFRIVLITASNVRATRWHKDTSVLTLMKAIAEHTAVAEKHFESEVVSVSVALVTRGKTPIAPRALRITNICGRIRHSHSSQFYNPGVLPLVNQTHNAFGSFETLLSVHGNLQTAQNRHNTLFRAGRCSASILMIVEHAFDPACIVQINMHMLVANVRLEHPITINCPFLDHRLKECTNWTYKRVVMTEEQAYMKSFQLSSLRPAWQEALLGVGQSDPKLAILLNVSKSGSVNFFVTIGKETPLTAGVEHGYTPLLDALVRFVDKYT